jgi:dienelactone hydrolase
MSSHMVGRSRWTTAALSLVTFLCLAGVVALMVWGTGAVMPAGRQPATSVVKSAVPAAASGEGAVIPSLETQDTPAMTAEAAAAVSSLASPDSAGPYRVGWYNTEFEVEPYGVYRASIYYPAQSDVRLAAPDASGALYPGIVASNGYYGSDWNITWLPQQLASHGYVALCFTPPAGGTLNTWTYSGLVQSWDTTQWAAGFKAGIDKLKEQNGLDGSLIRGLLDTGTFGVIGLSMGGAGALEAAGTSAEIDAVVGLAPAYTDVDGADGLCQLMALTGSPLAGDIPDWACWLLDAVDALGRLDRVFADVRTAAADIAVPAQVQVGSGDAFILPDWVHAAYDDIPGTSGKAYVEINGGSHAGFIDAWVLSFGDSLEQALGGGIEIEVQEQHRVSQKYFTSWFNYYLKGQTGYGTYLFGAEAQADVGGGVLSALETSIPG